MVSRFDVVVLGSGPAGSRAAAALSRAGKAVALVESRMVGGTCALRGCNPKEVLAAGAHLVAGWNRARGSLVRGPEATLHWQTLREFTAGFTAPVEDDTRSSLADAGVVIIEGSPRFVAPRAIEVDSARLEAEDFVIAVGARPRTLDIHGAHRAITSDEFFDLPEVPETVAFIGGGYISFELAHVTARCGARAMIVERSDRPLAQFDADHVERLVARGRREGIEVEVGRTPRSIEARGEKHHLIDEGGADLGAFDLVVNGTGRVPNLDGLDLEAAGIRSVDAGITVEASLRCVGAPWALAIGDCADTGLPPLTPAANAAARHAIRNLLEESKEPLESGPIPSVLFTTPGMARVGEDASHGGGRSVHDLDLGSAGSVAKRGEDTAAIKIVTGSDDDTIVGAHLLGPGAHEAIHLFTMAIRAGIGREELRRLPLAFPTFGSTFASAETDG